MNRLKKVMVFSEDINTLNQLCLGANSLGNYVSTVIVGTKEEAEGIANYCGRTYWLGEKRKDVMIEDYTPVIASIINEEKPNLVLIKATRRGKSVAGRLGVILNAAVITDAIAINIANENCLSIQRLVYGGTAVRTEKPLSEMAIALVGSGVLEPVENKVKGEVVEVKNFQVKNSINILRVKAKEEEGVDLSVAKRVVGIGRGISKQEDLSLVKDFAEKIGAEMACSRPIAEEEKWMPRGSYIGVSGVMIKPEVYFAIGISGQVQHMVGVNGAKTIIAINKDKNAPIFHYSDYGIVGDLYKVLPMLSHFAKE